MLLLFICTTNSFCVKSLYFSFWLSLVNLVKWLQQWSSLLDVWRYFWTSLHLICLMTCSSRGQLLLLKHKCHTQLILCRSCSLFLMDTSTNQSSVLGDPHATTIAGNWRGPVTVLYTQDACVQVIKASRDRHFLYWWGLLGADFVLWWHKCPLGWRGDTRNCVMAEADLCSDPQKVQGVPAEGRKRWEGKRQWLCTFSPSA